jgi:iron complex outermembrane receptor protein
MNYGIGKCVHAPTAFSPLASAVKVALATALLVTSSVAVAQDSSPPGSSETSTLDTVSVLGSRTKPRTVSSSAVPIDIISGEEFRNQGATDALDQLKVLVPSFNVSTIPIDDAASLIRPANLRGLPPDNTLLLVNGKRFHRAAVITFLGHGLSDGAQGPDLSVFPSLALEQVDVLRDGAAAQYGSDAIAGVINFGLKKLREGGTVEAFAGQNYEGDGLTTTYSAQVGLPLTERGFATLTAEWRNADDTSRSVQRDDAAAAIAAGYPGVGQPAQVWGSPKFEDDLKLVANLGLTTDSVDWYLFGNYAKREVDGGFYFRDPTARSGVYSNDGGDTLLVGNLTGAGACPTIPLRDGAGTLLPYTTVSGAVAALPANCYTFLSSLPGGFTPRFGGKLEDASVFAGAKGTLGEWYWDVSGSWGRNDIEFIIYNTVNASLGPAQPAGLYFRPGGNTQTEKSVNVDVSRDIATSFTYQPLRLAAGAEWREESFKISPGDGPSTAIGPLTEQGFALGSNGFNGFSSRTAGTFDRRNWAAYADLEAQVTERLLLAGALRFEDYDSFGSTTNGKVTGRFDFNEHFALRGAYNTGFRAPTPGQANISQISTVFGGTALEDIATLPPTNPIAQLKGARPLTPEESKNISFGAVWTEGDYLLTLDGYQIKVEDRIALSTSFAVTPAERAALVAGGNPEAASISQVTYFGNAFDTATTGVDLVTSYRSDHFGGTTTYSLAANWNRTEVDRFNPDFIDEAGYTSWRSRCPRPRVTSASTTSGRSSTPTCASTITAPGTKTTWTAG